MPNSCAYVLTSTCISGHRQLGWGMYSKRGREPQPASFDLNTIMALAAREVRVTTGDKHAVAIERKLIVDPQSGRAAHVENVAVAVQLEDGTVGVARQQRIHLLQDSGIILSSY